MELKAPLIKLREIYSHDSIKNSQREGNLNQPLKNPRANGITIIKITTKTTTRSILPPTTPSTITKMVPFPKEREDMIPRRSTIRKKSTQTSTTSPPLPIQSTPSPAACLLTESRPSAQTRGTLSTHQNRQTTGLKLTLKITRRRPTTSPICG